jgi:N-acetylmuramoyl-L-alanine amidase
MIKTYVTGSETYVMGLSKSDDNMNVVMKENQEILLEEDYETKYDGFDPNSTLSYIKFNILRDDNLTQSLEFAALVQDQFRTFAGRKDRGYAKVHFGYFGPHHAKVLLKRVLSLTGRGDYLISSTGQNTYARAIFNAFSQYRNQVEQRRREVSEPEVATTAAPAPTGERY